MRLSHGSADSEDGVTLVELLLAIAILGVVVGGAAVALTALAIGSDRGRRSAEASDLLAAVVATVVDPLTPYYPCTAPYPAVTIPPGVVERPELWSAKITSVKCLARYDTTPTFTTAGSATVSVVNQLQEVAVDVSKSDGRANRSVVIYKRNAAP